MSKIIRFIGDVHGKYRPYKKIIKDSPPSIQVGDMGVGFRRIGGYRDGLPHENPPHSHMVAGGHRFIRGNHDNPTACKTQSQWIPDGHIEDGMMFIGGAVSVDKEFRTEGFDWWADEELSYQELDSLIEVYEKAKPEVMVTHDCPDEVAERMCAMSGRRKLDWPSRTRRVLQVMWQIHKPKLWLFGHWHFSFDHVVDNGTRFVCLAELEYKDFEL